MKVKKEGPVGQGRGRRNTNGNKFACGSSIAPPGQKSIPHDASDSKLRVAWIAAATGQLAREISLVMLAADRLASGYTLTSDDLDRLHAAHQHILGALSSLIGREVTR
jgi:hypothetical protein